MSTASPLPGVKSRMLTKYQKCDKLENVHIFQEKCFKYVSRKFLLQFIQKIRRRLKCERKTKREKRKKYKKRARKYEEKRSCVKKLWNAVKKFCCGIFFFRKKMAKNLLRLTYILCFLPLRHIYRKSTVQYEI